jgi:hypothetical protein
MWRHVSRRPTLICLPIRGGGLRGGLTVVCLEPSLMRAPFNDQERRFYGQARPLELPPLPVAEAAQDVSRLLEADGLLERTGDAVDELLAFSRGHPQRTMLVARHPYEILDAEAPVEEPALEAIERALSETRDAHQALWDALPRAERIVCVALADGQAPTGSRVADEHRIPRSTLQDALERQKRPSDVGRDVEERRMAALAQRGDPRSSEPRSTQTQVLQPVAVRVEVLDRVQRAADRAQHAQRVVAARVDRQQSPGAELEAVPLSLDAGGVRQVRHVRCALLVVEVHSPRAFDPEVRPGLLRQPQPRPADQERGVTRVRVAVRVRVVVDEPVVDPGDARGRQSEIVLRIRRAVPRTRTERPSHVARRRSTESERPVAALDGGC